MKRISWNDPNAAEELKALYNRPACPREIEERATQIVAKVREEGDSAVCDFLERFDKVALTPSQFVVTEEECAEAEQAVSETAKQAIATAIEHVTTFAEQAKPRDHFFSPRPGVTLGERFLPMERVGCYIPGGTAPLVSTAIHTVAIARAAGVSSIVATTPVMKNGKVNPSTLYALKQAGATEVWKLGGAYAVAAMAYGTQTLKKVDKIVGPGNIYVANAKRAVYGYVGIDMVAGPSEVLIIADETANPRYVAADLLSQAEHDKIAAAMLITTSEALAKSVQEELPRQLAALPRQEIAAASLENNGAILLAEDLDTAFDLANRIAPEHLELSIADAFSHIGKVENAGACFVGHYSPEPLGDYFAGPNHVLPTSGTARFFSPLNVEDFLKKTSIVYYSREKLQESYRDIERFALAEHLDAHARSAVIRFEDEN